MQLISRTLLVPSIISSCLLATVRDPISAGARPARPDAGLDVQIELDEHVKTMVAIVQRIAFAAKLNVVADGQPLRPNAELKFTGTARQALDRVCTLFDFSWREGPGGTIIFVKRYSNPEDMPLLYARELRKTAKDVLSALPPSVPDPDMRAWPNSVRALAATLTPEQLQRLRAGEQLSYMELAPVQRQKLAETVNTRAFGVVRGIWEQMFLHLDRPGNTALQFITPPGLERANVSLENSRFVGLVTKRGTEVVAATPIGELGNSAGPASGGGQADSNTPDPTAVAVGNATMANRSATGVEGLSSRLRLDMSDVSLSAMLAEIQRQSGVRVTAAEYLAAHKLTAIVGGATVRQALDAIAALEDWTWRETEPGSYLVEGKPVYRARSPRDAPRCMQAALPRDLRAYLHLPDLENKDPFRTAGAAGESAVMEGIDRSRSRLLTSLADTLAKKELVPYGNLSARQQTDLLFLLLFLHYDEFAPILNNNIGVHHIDPRLSAIHLEDGGRLLMINMILDRATGNKIGFGSNVSSVIQVSRP